MNAASISGIFAPSLRKSVTPANRPNCIDILACRKGISRGKKCSNHFALLGYCILLINTCEAAAGNGSAIVSDGGMLQVVLGLGFVLALMGGLAWLLRRFGGPQQGSAGTIKIIGGSAVGQRERVVLVEVADTWLVVGVAPGNVTALHTMPKGEVATSAGQARDNTRFSTWLRQTIEKQMIEKQAVEKQTAEKQTVETRQSERNGE
jgi:flagellar protein FliO/FliZ